MILPYFQKFIAGSMKVEDFLQNEFDNITSQIQAALTAITFNDNMDGFKSTVTILAGETTTIVNRLSTIPTGFLTLRQTGAGQLTEDADRLWTNESLSIKNNGAVPVTATLFFLR